MKRKSIIIAMLLVTSLTYAQLPQGFWLMGAGNSSTISSNQLEVEPGIGYEAGLMYTLGYNESFNYEFRIGYTTNSFELTKGNLETQKFQRASLGLNFSFNYYIIKPDENKFYVGAQVGVSAIYNSQFSIKGDEGSFGTFYLPNKIEESTILNNVTGTNSAGNIGIVGGYNRFRFLLKYETGFGNYFEGLQSSEFNSNNENIGEKVSGKLSSISFSLFYKFKPF